MKHRRRLTYTIGIALAVLFGVSFWASAVSDTSQTTLTTTLGSLFSIAVLLLGACAYYWYVHMPQRKPARDVAHQEDEQNTETKTLETIEETYEPEHSTQEIPVVDQEEEDLEITQPERSRVMSGNELRRSLLGVKRVLVWMTAVWLFATFVAIVEYASSASHTGLYVIIGVSLAVLLAAGDIPLRLILRKRYRDVSDGSAREDTLYQECPHFTLILRVTVIQVLLWLLTLSIGIVTYTHGAAIPLWATLYIQWLVTIINLYLIGKRYVEWKGTIYIWTRSHYTVVRQRDVFFGLTNVSSKSYVAGTLVRADVAQGILEQPPLFERRGTATIRTQDESESDITVLYVYDPVRFQEASKIATS